MVLLQHKLSLKVSQKQILTPGLVQMVSVLALNKLELADMINAELTENPVLEELDNSVPLLDEVSAREEQKERDSSIAAQEQTAATTQEKDPFEEIDFGSFFSEYLDPGMRTPIEMEDSEKPSFENFLSKPSTLTDHLMWQLGSLHVNEDVYRAAELVIGNLNEEGYLIATDDELLGLAQEEMAALRGLCRAVPLRRPKHWIATRSQFLSDRRASHSSKCANAHASGSRRISCRRGGSEPSECCRCEDEAATPKRLRRVPLRKFRVLRWFLRAPRRQGCLSAVTPCAKPSTWSSRWTPSA